MKQVVTITALGIIFALVATGCIESRYVRGLTPQQQIAANEMRVYRESPPKERYQVVEKVKGLSCQITHDDYDAVISRADAMTELKKAAAKAGANALIDVHCKHHLPGVIVNYCWESITCSGSAVLISSEAS